ncbi:hypothetical protein HC725_02035 [Vibrio sp. S17_S38]|uniref:hypothetical protein n=1 Tax=Vibrio sp. S17_S38 TaxID=2720229 RepID=UPI00168065FD|nr:hypothetical protein [Vibrio sp. S17_S38]MBD1572058.1 hypothetical protein [Vibrio sp. S17_S38]
MNYFLVHCNETGTAIRNDSGEVKSSLLGEFDSFSDAACQAEIQFNIKHIHRGVFAVADACLRILMDAQEFSEL